MDGRVLRGGARPGRPGGFTFVEVLIAMAITVAVMLANLALFDTAHRNLAYSRALTEATNLATNRIADFKTMAVADILNAAPNVQASPNPLNVRWGSDTPTVDGVLFTRTWTFSSVDVDHDAAPDMVGDLVKVKMDVTWTMAGRAHHVSMATFTTGKPE
jgi:prepilin-type N-terminal cleavage/methylation domain-containing protein